jgi:DNA modification methylase
MSPPGGTVLDPFSGAGTTGAAAVAEGRSFVGAEIVAPYCDIAEERMRQAAKRTLRVRDPDLPIEAIPAGRKVTTKPTQFLY